MVKKDLLFIFINTKCKILVKIFQIQLVVELEKMLFTDSRHFIDKPSGKFKTKTQKSWVVFIVKFPYEGHLATKSKFLINRINLILS